MKPNIAMCNIFSDTDKLRRFAQDNGFSGIDWSFDYSRLPATPAAESQWAAEMACLAPLEIRFHCPFHQIDLGHGDLEEAKAAKALFRRIIRLVSKVGGRYLTIHIGLGRDSTEPLSWEVTMGNLRHIVQYGDRFRVMVCLENLAWGWTSRPNLFEKLIRGSGAAVTFDMGHARECESVYSQQYVMEDFVTPHSERFVNAHIYHRELPGVGHVPPNHLEDIKDRLSILLAMGCPWWVIEIREADGLLRTKVFIDEYLMENNVPSAPKAHAL